MHQHAHLAVTCALSCALTLGAAAALAPSAYADDAQADLESAQSAYSQAQQKVDDLQSQIDENQGKIDELNAKLPALKEGAASSIRSQYKMQQSSGSLLDLVLSADSFNDFISSIQYLDVITSKNADGLNDLNEATSELTQATDELKAQQQEAIEARSDAERKLESARAAAAAVAQKAAEEQAAEAAEAAQAEQEAAAAQGQTFTTASGNQATVEAAPQQDQNSSSPSSSTASSTSEAIESNVSQDDASSWASRIDAFLAGTPLAGQGATFAAAAAAYGVDPRVSPAIAMVESGAGRACFKPHNAWGWGSSSWGSWEEAIYAHVKGFAAGYGSTVTPSVARKYCPPNSSFWYSSVTRYMNSI